jgi:uroporphyrinogen decarboxylase
MGLKPDKMTNQERIGALFSYEKPDRVPIFGMGNAFSMINCGYSLTELQTDPQKFWNAHRWTCEQYRWEPFLATPAHTVMGSWDFGAKMKMPDSPYATSIAVDTPPVSTEEDVWNLAIPDSRTAGAIPKRMEFSRLADQAGWPIVFHSRSPFTMAANICGVEQFARWLLRQPELCERLMDLALNHAFNALEYWIDTFGAENIVYYMSSPTEANQLFSPKHIQAYALPYHKAFHTRLRARGVRKFVFHICGEQNLNLPMLGEFASTEDGWPHPSVLSFGHEVELRDAARHFPDDIIMGTVEPALIQTGSPQQVYEQCRTYISEGKKTHGGFVLAPGCGLPPKSAPYNVWMMTKAVNDFGYYE